MKTFLKRFAFAMALAVGLGYALTAFGAEAPAGLEMPAQLPTLQGPVLTTSCGQSPGSVMVRLLCKQQGIACTEDDAITAAQLKKGEYNTLIVTMGTSLKGMGAAGVDINAETKRVEDLIAKAKELGMFVMGTQIEGKSRRTDETDEASNNAVAPNSDMIVIMKEIDYDSFFTNAAKKNNVPIIYLQKNLDFGYVLQVLFGVNK